MTRNVARVVLVVCLLSFVRYALMADVSYRRLLGATTEPQNWLTYSGSYFSQRYSTLRQVDRTNISDLEQKWIYQAAVIGTWQATPLVVDGIMYLTQRANDVVALDARTGRVFWIYRHSPSSEHTACCGANNRGVAILGETLFIGTLDARLIAIDAKSGRPKWNVEVADFRAGYSLTLAPLVVKDKVIVGVGGGELGVRGFIAAYDAETGKEAWRFHTIPGPGEPGHETWEPCPSSPTAYCDPEAWKHGGGSIWTTGSFDPELNLIYWGVGNASPDWNASQRPGDNLYTASLVALEADTGKLKWHYQATPHDEYDYDAVQIPVLVDMTLDGSVAKVVLWANRNGYFYVLDRATGKFLLGRPFAKVNWSNGFDERGRPFRVSHSAGTPIWPGNQGATNWYSPSYSPRTGLFYVSVWEDYATIFESTPARYQQGRMFGGGGFRQVVPVPGAPVTPFIQRGPINNWTEAAARGAVIALDARTGERRWTFSMTDVTDSGILTTAADLLFSGGREGYFQALDARTGTLLWRANLGGQIVNGPITYQVNGKQYIAVIAGHVLASFALRD
jgi:alcohol dehydrogenase (cytochrome c)